MSRDDIIRMAIKCELVTTVNRDGVYMDALYRFAAVVAAEEREACAAICDEEAKWSSSVADRNGAGAAVECGYKIRARGR